MDGRALRGLLAECKKLVGYDGDVKLRLRAYKTKAAAAHLRRREVVINSQLLGLDEDALRYLLIHELVHLKLGKRHHDAEFNKVLYSLVPPERVEEARRRILEILLTSWRKSLDRFF
ncbi:SprT-like domain-containing protein [Candidatus Nitrosocaldus islandicus]|uniref:SprT-like domain-containing protein n=1 Tax=Candidatus Nitrosocaldus islandicus TaxID=2045011 RepID=UPI000CD22389|nr:SprT-like domain-containing protein [Candidatus Nitrosocaldus islandicus]